MMKKSVFLKSRTATTTILFPVVLYLSAFVNQVWAIDTKLVSVDSSGTLANNNSNYPAISADGRYVVFESNADNLVATDTNAVYDIFVHSTQTDATTRVSVDSSGTQANNGSYDPAISAGGRYVAFRSDADNLVATDTNSASDIFVHDTQTGTTTRVSVDSSGTQANNGSYAPAISAGGRYVAFRSDADNLVATDTNGASDIFVHDTQTGATTRVSVDSSGAQANGPSLAPAISADGIYVAFYSGATDLVANDTNGVYDIFVHNIQAGATTRVSVDSTGAQADFNSYSPAISANGKYVAFASGATNLVSGDTNGAYDIFIHDTQTGATTRVSMNSSGTQADGPSFEPAISADGRYVAFESDATNLVAADTNGNRDIFIHHPQTGATTRASVDSSGAQANNDSSSPVISIDGGFVAFDSAASNLVTNDTNGVYDIFIHQPQVQVGATTRVSVNSLGIGANNDCEDPVISGDGRYVAFSTYASNLVSDDYNNDRDIFLVDNQTGIITRRSETSFGIESNNDSNNPALSADGGYVAFDSSATNLIFGDTNGYDDIFYNNVQTGDTGRVNYAHWSLTQANNSSSRPSLSADGTYVAFNSSADNLVAGDTNNSYDIFVCDTQSATVVTIRVSVDSTGSEANDSSYAPAISGDGRYVAFFSYATNLVAGDTNGFQDIFVHDTQTGATSLVSVDSSGVQANDHSSSTPAISAGGRYVAFATRASNLVANDTNAFFDVFVHDTRTGATSRVSVDSLGTQANGSSFEPAISADGRYVAFESDASNLVLGDTNGVRDIFVHDTHSGATTRVSIDSAGTQADLGSYAPVLAADGSHVAFESVATNLVPGDTNGRRDIFIHNFLPNTSGGSGGSNSADGAGGGGSGGCFIGSLIQK
jgi:Tol biopolymer transport system component